ncbi:MAG TPA: nitrous oxide reductase accessory protein NosL [Gemmataceae bacterium]|jgi:copper chaperone NosL
MTTKTFVAAWLFALAAGCSGATEDRPPSLRFGEEACDHCRMLINDDRFAAALVTADGETRKFDEVGCLLEYQAKDPAPARRSWVRCYRSSQWLDAQQAFFVHSPQLHTPMGCGLAALPTFANARELADELHGRIVLFNELPSVRKSQTGGGLTESGPSK